MLIEFDNGWQLTVHDQRKHLIGGGTLWGSAAYSITHGHPAHHNDGGMTWQDTNMMIYHEVQVCKSCGESPPDALHGYVRLMDWSFGNAD